MNLNTTGPGAQYEGRVEIYHNGEWGTICDHDWTFEDAKVVCRMAGFASAVRPVLNNYYGRGDGVVWLDHVQCTGHETTLLDCDHDPFGDVHTSCQNHLNDAGVVCSDGNYIIMMSSFITSNVSQSYLL